MLIIISQEALFLPARDGLCLLAVVGFPSSVSVVFDVEGSLTMFSPLLFSFKDG